MLDWEAYFDQENARLDAAIRLALPPSRAETIKEGWRLYGHRFDYGLGRMLLEHDLGIIEPVLFELIDYAAVTVIEAEGVVVAKLPKIG